MKQRQALSLKKSSVKVRSRQWTDSINIIECNDDRSEAQYVSEEVKRLIEKEDVDPTEIIFYRTNGQSRIIEDSFGIHREVAGINSVKEKKLKTYWRT